MNKIQPNIRSMAINAIGLIVHNKAFSTNIIKDNIDKIDNPKDQSLFREMVYGVTENLIYLDYIISKASNTKLKKIERFVLDALRLGVYELVFLRISNYATLNELVKIVKKKKGVRAGNFTNGILRNIDRNLEDFKQVDVTDPVKKLSITYSYNEDIISYLSKYFNEDDLIKILKSLSNRPSLSVRVNDVITDIDTLEKALNDYGFETHRSKFAQNCLIVDRPINITQVKEFKQGHFTIQDQGSIKVSEVLNPKKDSMILDLCAAPGSKSTHLAQIARAKSKVVANDISSNKLSKIEENFGRMNFENYEITNHDATKKVDEFVDKFDYVLVDAPCSGLGVIMRKPEIKLNRSLEEIEELAKIQYQILANSIDYVKSGGKIVYSTCTIGDLENKDIVDKILKDRDDIEVEMLNDKKYLEILPHINDSDGFFIVKFTKK